MAMEVDSLASPQTNVYAEILFPVYKPDLFLQTEFTVVLS